MGQNTEKYLTFSLPIEKKLQEIVKIDKKFQDPYLIDENIIMAQNLWQVSYQILLIILLKEFIKLNVNMSMIKKYGTC